MISVLQDKRFPEGSADQQEYRLLFAVTFVAFLVAAIVMRLTGLLQGDVQPAALRKSLFAEAKAMGYNSLAFAFMG